MTFKLAHCLCVEPHGSMDVQTVDDRRGVRATSPAGSNDSAGQSRVNQHNHYHIAEYKIISTTDVQSIP